MAVASLILVNVPIISVSKQYLQGLLFNYVGDGRLASIWRETAPTQVDSVDSLRGVARVLSDTIIASPNTGFIYYL